MWQRSAALLRVVKFKPYSEPQSAVKDPPLGTGSLTTDRFLSGIPLKDLFACLSKQSTSAGVTTAYGRDKGLTEQPTHIADQKPRPVIGHRHSSGRLSYGTCRHNVAEQIGLARPKKGRFA